MRVALLLVLAAVPACTDNDLLDPPEDCGPGRLTYSAKLEGHLKFGDHGFSSFTFVNAVGGQPGTLSITGGSGSDGVMIEFTDLVADGGDVPARGTVTLAGPEIVLGNCETASLSGRLFVDGNSRFRFSLTDLHELPACSGAAVSGGFAACYQGM